MKKSFSYLMPVGALLVLTALGVQWLRRSPTNPQISQNAEGIEISDMTGSDILRKGAKDVQTVVLTPKQDGAEGEVRYQYTPDGVNFTVQTLLPTLKTGEHYQLWVEGEKGKKKALKLVEGKGGYIGQGTLSAEFDTVTLSISKEMNDDANPETVVLEGEMRTIAPVGADDSIEE